MTRFIAKTINYSELYRYVRHRQSEGMEDLLTFVRPNFGGKVIFAGDPVQLPPVGESISNVLRAEYFSPKTEKITKKIHFPPKYMPYFQRKILSL